MEYQTIKEKGKVKYVVLPIELFETLSPEDQTMGSKKPKYAAIDMILLQSKI